MRTKHASRRRSQPILISLLLPLMLMILSSCGGTTATPPAADATHRRAGCRGSNSRAGPGRCNSCAGRRSQPPRRPPKRPPPPKRRPRRPPKRHRRVPTAAPESSRRLAAAQPRLSGGISAPRRCERDNWQNLANTFVKDHPDVSIEITVLENEAFKAKLATAMQSGSPPDIFQSWGGGVLKQYADAGLVQDLTPSLQDNDWGDSFQPGPLSLYTFDGKTYGVPWNAGMVGFWYNKALFKKAGIDAPPATWTDFLADVKKLKAANITPIAVGEKDKWPGHFYWVYLAMRIGGKAAFDKAYNREGSFADPPFVDAGTKLKELIDLQPFQNGFLGAGYGDHQALMANGKAAMELMGQWAPGANRGVAAGCQGLQRDPRLVPVPGGRGWRGRSIGCAGWRRRLCSRQERAQGSDRLRALPDQCRQPDGDGQGRASPCRRR